MLDSLISSKTRIKLLLRFFLNPNHKAYLRGLASDFGESTNAVRLELNKMEKAGLIEGESQGNRKMFKANNQHPLFEEIRNIVMKHLGLDQLLVQIVHKLGDVKKVYLTGDLAKGIDTDMVDVALVGGVDTSYLVKLVTTAESVLQRKIRYVVFSEEEAEKRDWDDNEYLVLWEQE